MKLSVLFEDPFWIALLEDERDGLLYAVRHVFGSEPSSEELYEFIRSPQYGSLVERMTIGLPVNQKSAGKRINPKRRQRQIKREKERVGVSSQSHEVMRLQQEERKKERKTTSKAEKNAQRRYKRELAQQKRKAKHRGK